MSKSSNVCHHVLMWCAFSFCSNQQYEDSFCVFGLRNVEKHSTSPTLQGCCWHIQMFCLELFVRIVRRERQSSSQRFAAKPFLTKSTLLTRPWRQQNFKVTPPDKWGVQSPSKSSNNQQASDPVLLFLDETSIFITAESIRQHVFILSRSILHIWSIEWHHTLEDVALKMSVWLKSPCVYCDCCHQSCVGPPKAANTPPWIKINWPSTVRQSKALPNYSSEIPLLVTHQSVASASPGSSESPVLEIKPDLRAPATASLFPVGSPFQTSPSIGMRLGKNHSKPPQARTDGQNQRYFFLCFCSRKRKEKKSFVFSNLSHRFFFPFSSHRDLCLTHTAWMFTEMSSGEKTRVNALINPPSTWSSAGGSFSTVRALWQPQHCLPLCR